MPSAATTRFAPSPTGEVHLGNARTFLINYLLARAGGWRILMRMEDLDCTRARAGADQQLLDDLKWLGLAWEEPVVYQSKRAAVYDAALRELAAMGAAYPCTCGRKDVELASGAPHADDACDVYPGLCRGKYASAQEARERTGRAVAWRLRVPDEAIEFHDEFAGPCSFNLAKTCGDFVIVRKEGFAAYQLAVVVDDAPAVDAIVRGDDLLESAARQIHIRRLLGLHPQPRYWHLPLVVGSDGRRLAKRHGDTRLGFYRQAGAAPQRALGLLGYWSGLLPRRQEADMRELLKRFDLAKVPRGQVVFTDEDHRFLMGC